MRFCLTIAITISMLSFSTGCETFRQKIGANGSKSSLFGLKGPGKRRLDPDEVLDPLGARDGNRLLLDDLAPSQLATTFKVRTRGLDEEAARSHFAEGQRLYQSGASQLSGAPSGAADRGTFLDAASEFRLAAASWPDSTIEEDALFLEGEACFFADHYVQSNRAFEKLISNFSGSKYLDQAEHRRYVIAVYWLEIADTGALPTFTDAKRPKVNVDGEARRVLHQIRIDDPSGKLAPDATLALGKAFMKSNSYYEAADTFEDLRTNYPGSKHQFTSHMLELEAHLQGYQGKSYDDTPLRKADELLKKIVRSFPNESQEQLPYLEKQASSIQSMIAERDYTVGRYYEGRGENRAAKIYYEKVAKKYKDTPLGASIGDQIAKVASLPPKPQQPIQWLVKAFPDPEAAKPVIQAGNNEPFFR